MNDKYTLHVGNNVDILKTCPDNHFDSVVTDPPYGIDFLGKAWDSDTGSIETYKECLRVLKPGGHLLAFSAARTYHHLAMSVELAGFEIRDQIMWVYSSGFPKSQDVGRSIQRSLGVKKTKTRKGAVTGNDILNGGFSGGSEKAGEFKEVEVTDPVAQQWSGWGTALKPAHEPIVVARKPLKTSVAKNVQIWGTGALNIDATRIPLKDGEVMMPSTVGSAQFTNMNSEKNAEEGLTQGDVKVWIPGDGRFPSNVLGELPEYQKYFYCPKVSRKERHIGHETPPPMFGDVKGCYDENGERFAVGLDATNAVVTTEEMLATMGGYYVDNDGMRTKQGKFYWTPHLGMLPDNNIKGEYVKYCEANGIEQKSLGNNHPTVKPQALMEYLIKLVTPPEGRVLDPFNGSGSTGMAAVKLGHHYTGIDLDEKYIEISNKRISAWNNDSILFDSLFENDE